MRYSVRQKGESRSFPTDDPFLKNASSDETDVVIYLGATPDFSLSKKAVLIELGTECLIECIDETNPTCVNAVGFCRYRNGADPPSQLIEIVRLPSTQKDAVEAAKSVFEAAGFIVVVCDDQPGRIIDRLLRPKYNAALRFLDEGLATAEDIDTTCRLGLGYPSGPIERVVRGGLAYHYDVTQTLFETFGTAAFAPPRRAVAAKRR